jgi:hypothetical protein
MERRRDFGKCHRCGLDVTTGEGERDSRWDGAYLPLDLDEYCDTCRLTFFTCEADPAAYCETSRMIRSSTPR